MIFSGWNYTHGQEANNNCSNAVELCPGQVVTANNIGANVTFCPNCEDDFNYCFTTDNTIWFEFTTNQTGGNVQVDVSNLIFENNPGQDNELQATIIQAAVPCDASTYTQIGNCLSNETANFTLTGMGLTANTTYYVVIDGDMTGAGITSPAECTFDISVSGPGVDRPLSILTVTADTTSICLNDIAGFAVSLTDCPSNGNFEWYINDSLVAVTTDTLFFTSELQDGDIVTVETTCYSLCPDSVSASSVPISVYSFFIDAGVDLTINNGTAVQLLGSTTATDYSWAPAFLVSDPNVINPIADPSETTTFAFTATQNGCTLTDYVTITVIRDLEIPNTFSPNGDGNNESWIIPGIDTYPDNLMIIYDRWGQEIFKTTGYSEIRSWNGKTKRGGNASEGVYYYVLDLRDGVSDIINGTITLIR